MKTRIFVAFVCALSTLAFAGVEQSVNDLIPKLASQKVEDRYAAQMELQALAANASRPGAPAERAELAKILAAKTTETAVPQPARVWLVRQLEYIGASESVAALTTLLNGREAELRECARRALEKNSTPTATESLRAALKQGGDTSWKAGLIQSLGERGDAAAISLIAPNLHTPELAFAAANALGKIATEPALKELWAALDKQVAPAANALVLAASRLAATGQSAPAAALYQRLATTCSAPQLRAAALTGLARTAPAEAKKLIPNALNATELQLQSAAITAAREVYGKALSAELLALFPNLNPTGKVLTLRELDASAENQVIATVGTDPSETVRLAALETLGRIGSAASVPLLLKSATDSPAPVQKIAASALARVPGVGADALLRKLAGRGDARSRTTAIKALAERNDTASIPTLLKYATESDRSISSAACTALGQLGSDQEVEALVKLALAGTTPEAETALQSVAARAQNKAAIAKLLLGLSQTAQPQQMPLVFGTLVMVGGEEALRAVSQAAASNDEELKDAAIRALANWQEFAATKPLLIVATDPNTKRVHNVLAVQGIARLVKTADKEPTGARLEAVNAAMSIARRDEEKKLLLSAIASIPSAKAAAALQP
ncbi:MAG TPA: HEAT repeat domain-containing protein, partial [Candidatus Sulfotelmatobacter sp.]|nr:HEAT repeat domain-containing protein [Candidatus Sulfotelmatobacter sp.]